MKAVILAAVTLAGCAPATAPAGNADSSTTPAGIAQAPPSDRTTQTCDASKADGLLNRVVDTALRDQAMRITGARITRVIPPGAVVTMEYSADRLNIDTDAASRATRFHCG